MESDLILITYQTAGNDYFLLEQLFRRHKILLILDESHNIKNPDGVRAQVSLRLLC
jgi:SNF2 family DNA or RNA helicase